MTSRPLDILLAHNDWATRRLLDRCATLSEADFHRRFDIGPGSLHDTLTHTVACIVGWCALIEGDPWPEPAGTRTPTQIAGDLTAATATARRLADGPLERGFEVGDPPTTYTVGATLTHCLNHGTHHRAQCLNLLRRLGETEPLDLGIDAWQRQTQQPHKP